MLASVDGRRPLASPHGAAHRGLRVDRRPAHRGAGRPGRVGRLAVPAAVRLPRVLCGPARHRGPRPLAALPGRRVRRHPPLPRLLDDPRDDVLDRHRRGDPGRRDAVRRPPGRPGPPHHRSPRHRAHAARVGRAHRLRQRPPLGTPPHRRRRAGHHRRRRSRPADPARAAPAVGGRGPAPRRVRRRRGRRAHVLHHLGAVVRGRAGPEHHRRAARGDPARRRGLAVGGDERRPAPRPGAPLPPDPPAADARADRWDRRRPHHLVAGGLRRRAQLGLPLLLAPGRRADPGRLHPGGLHRGGHGVAQLAAAGGGRRPGGPPDHVRRRRRPPAPRTRARAPSGVRRQPRRCGSGTAR